MSKEETSGAPVRQFPFAPVMVVPLSQHLGKPARPLVRAGQEVMRGQCMQCFKVSKELSGDAFDQFPGIDLILARLRL